MRRPLLPFALGMITAVVATAPAIAAGGPARPCPIIVFTPNSGDGLFDIKVRNISCSAARAKLRAVRGEPERLTSWTCRLARREQITGAGRYHCTNRLKVHGTILVRLIAYTTGN